MNMPRQYTQNRGLRAMAAELRQTSDALETVGFSGYLRCGFSFHRNVSADRIDANPAAARMYRQDMPAESSQPPPRTQIPIPTDQNE